MEADAGVDVLNDGEMSKPSYATYVKDRLTGFGGEGSIAEVAAAVIGPAWTIFPISPPRWPRPWPRPRRSIHLVHGPVSYAGQGAVQADIDNLTAATEAYPRRACS